MRQFPDEGCPHSSCPGFWKSMIGEIRWMLELAQFPGVKRK